MLTLLCKALYRSYLVQCKKAMGCFFMAVLQEVENQGLQKPEASFGNNLSMFASVTKMFVGVDTRLSNLVFLVGVGPKSPTQRVSI